MPTRENLSWWAVPISRLKSIEQSQGRTAHPTHRLLNGAYIRSVGTAHPTNFSTSAAPPVSSASLARFSLLCVVGIFQLLAALGELLEIIEEIILIR